MVSFYFHPSYGPMFFQRNLFTIYWNLGHKFPCIFLKRQSYILYYVVIYNSETY